LSDSEKIIANNIIWNGKDFVWKKSSV
jgi:hypothetical protein